MSPCHFKRVPAKEQQMQNDKFSADEYKWAFIRINGDSVWHMQPPMCLCVFLFSHISRSLMEFGLFLQIYIHIKQLMSQ